MNKYKDYQWDYVKGMIIARGYLSDCIKVDSKFKDMLMEEEFWIYVDIIQDDCWEGYAFRLENIEKIDDIEINGKFSLWDYNKVNWKVKFQFVELNSTIAKIVEFCFTKSMKRCH